MTDALDHGHAAALLSDPLDLETYRVEVAEAGSAHGLSGVVLEDISLDLDVPIPLILKVEACSRLRFTPTWSRPSFLVYVDIWGEAYDGDYGTRVRMVTEQWRRTIYQSPPEDGAADPARWLIAVHAVAAEYGRPFGSKALTKVLTRAIPAPLRQTWATMLRRF